MSRVAYSFYRNVLYFDAVLEYLLLPCAFLFFVEVQLSKSLKITELIFASAFKALQKSMQDLNLETVQEYS